MEGVHGRRKDMNNFISTIEGFFGIKNGLLLNKLCQFLDGAEYKNLVILSYDSLTVENFKKYLSNNSFLFKHWLFNISVPKCSSCDLSHDDLLSSINSLDGCRAYGVFPFGDGKYDSLQEATDRIVNFSNGPGKRLIYVSFKGIYAPNQSGFNKLDHDCFQLCQKLDDSAILIISEDINDDFKVPVCAIKRMISSEGVRLAALKDLDSVNKLVFESYDNRMKLRPDIFERRINFTKSEFYNYCNRNSVKTCLVYEISEEIVGFIIFNIKFVNNIDYFKDRSFLIINNIYVKSKYRRRGIGTKLYNEACNYGKKFKIKSIEINFLDEEIELKNFVDSLNMKRFGGTYEMKLIDVK